MIKKAKEHPLAIRRKELGLSRQQLCERINGKVSRETIGRIERGERTPRSDTIGLLAEALDCEPDYLLGRIPHPRRNISDIANQIPLSGNATEGLMNLKRDRDSDNLKELNSPNPYSTFAEAIDYMICGILGSAGYCDDFDDNQIHDLLFDLINTAIRIKGLHEMPAEQAASDPFFEDYCNQMDMAYKGKLFNIGQELASLISDYVNKHVYSSEEV